MQKASIPHDALVFVGDGTRAVFFRNRGVHSRIGPRRSSVEETDWHRIAEDSFAAEIAAALHRLSHGITSTGRFYAASIRGEGQARAVI